MIKPELHAAQEEESDAKPEVIPSSAFSFSAVVAAVAAVVCEQE